MYKDEGIFFFFFRIERDFIRLFHHRSDLGEIFRDISISCGDEIMRGEIRR